MKGSAKMNIEITNFERLMLENILTSVYGDAIDDPIWSDCWDCGDHNKFCDDRQASGIISSLVKKGLVATDRECFWLTEQGVKISRELNLKGSQYKSNSEKSWRVD